MMWGFEGDEKLGNWEVVRRHRERAEFEGFCRGVAVGAIIAVAFCAVIFWMFL